MNKVETKLLKGFFSEDDIKKITAEVDVDFDNVQSICLDLCFFFAKDFLEGKTNNFYKGARDKIASLLDQDNVLNLCEEFDKKNGLGVVKNVLVVSKALLIINEKSKKQNVNETTQMTIETDIVDSEKQEETKQDVVEENKQDVVEETKHDERKRSSATSCNPKIVFCEDYKEEENVEEKRNKKNTLDIILVVMIILLSVIVGIILYKGISDGLLFK